jgi:hypothetical protein
VDVSHEKKRLQKENGKKATKSLNLLSFSEEIEREEPMIKPKFNRFKKMKKDDENSTKIERENMQEKFMNEYFEL